MVGERLDAKDLRVLAIWIVLGIAGAWFAHRYFFVANPEASVDFRVSRPEALEIARKFVTAQGQNLDAYQSSIVFQVDDNAKTYLERELGLAQANRMMSQEISVWYWEARFFRPQQEEEFLVQVSPAGLVAGYEHKIPEAQAGAKLERAAALQVAKHFLQADYHADLNRWDFLQEEANSTQRTNRLDWSFTWERHAFKAKDAPYRLRVTVQGDHPGKAEEFLKVPEAWQRGYDRLRSSNIFYNEIALLPYAVLFGLVLWSVYDFMRRGEVHWGGPIKLGLFVAALFFLMQVNDWPIERAGYDTNSSYAGFLASRLFLGLLLGLGSGLMVALTLPAAEPLYRHDYPDRLRLGATLTMKGIRTKEFFRSSVIGLAMAGFHIGFVVLFYLVGGKFGVWAPQELSYTNSVSTAFPWISGVTIGVFAATSEEFLFRLFAIPILLRLTRSRILAVVLPAFSWGFLHSAYPTEPGYIRGIEVGLIGILAGVVFLRWGILATLIWHYTVDAMLVGLFLLRSDNLYFRISGAVVGAAALIPLGLSGLSYLARGRFETDESLLNRSVPETAAVEQVSAEPTAPVRAKTYSALTPGALGFLLAVGILGGILLLKVKPAEVGGFVEYKVNARQAESVANGILRQHKVDPVSYRHATVLVDRFDGVTNEYLRRKVGPEETNRIYRENVPGVLWRVRYFRDSEKEEYAVVLHSDGTLHAIRHTLAEDAPGASLSKEDAQARAETYLRSEKHVGLSQWKLIEPKSDKRPKRIDHTITWEEKRSLEPAAPNNAEAAHERIEVQVLGDEVSGFRTYIQIPEEWRRKQEETTLARTLYRFGGILIYVALGLTPLVIFLKNLRSTAAASIPWRRIAQWSTWALAGFLVVFSLGDRIPNFLALYDTAIPLKFLFGGLGIGVILGGGFYFGGLMLLFGLAWYFCAKAFGEERLPSWTGMPREYYRDALGIAVGGSAALLGAGRLAYLLGRIWPTLHHSFPADLPQSLDAYFPAAQEIGRSITGGLFVAGLIALAGGFLGAVLRQHWARLLFFLVLAVMLVGDWGSPADFAKQLLARAFLLAIIVMGAQRLVRFNLLGYFLIAAVTALSEAAVELLSQPNSFYRVNGIAVAVALAALLVWPLMAWRSALQPNAN
ncbi:MAG TPA: CPBP family intramembrane glutamic endopeptidase [Candidatus Acidoferrales bacterium]|nr:CPBP family intramembrane glutamic endopeptidase [Candidatus Acidoferrales bacterium]